MAMAASSVLESLSVTLSSRFLPRVISGRAIDTAPFFARSVMRRRLSSIAIGRHCVAPLHTSAGLSSGGEYEWQDPKSPDEIVTISYVDCNGNQHTVKGKIGDNILYLAHKHEIEMEGACEASLACTTCHVYVDRNYQDLLPEAHEEEEDLLDLAPFLQENSRLGMPPLIGYNNTGLVSQLKWRLYFSISLSTGCQIKLTKELNGITVTLPKATRNFYVDGHKPQPH